MLGILVALLISWFLIYFFQKESILALGFFPISKRLNQFLNGLVITAILCALAQYAESLLMSSTWVWNESITSSVILKSFWWDFRSVLTEELIFRGALLYILIKKIGQSRAILISAIAFGIYHWFSFGVIGDVMAMVLVFMGTGIMGYAWAWAFSKTKSMMLPLGFHFGWNFIHNTIFSKGPLGDLILISQGGTDLTGWISLFNFLLGLLFVPILLLIYISFYVPEEKDAHKPRNQSH